MIAVGLWLRLALFVPVVFLAMVVYASLKETDAVGTLRSAVQKTGKTMVYMVAIAVAMLAIEWAFID